MAVPVTPRPTAVRTTGAERRGRRSPSRNISIHTIGTHQRPGRAVGLLPVQRPRLHQRGRADAGARLPAGAFHQAVRGAGADAAVHNGASRLRRPRSRFPRSSRPTRPPRLRRRRTPTAVAPATVPGRSRPTPQSHFPRRRKAPSSPSRIPTRTSWISSSTAATERPVAPATHSAADPGGVVDGSGADGWFKMFEFFEVPSQSLGAIGPVAQGTNFDWARQDTKPGLLNLNLIIDEEVFFSVLGSQSITLKNGVGAAAPTPTRSARTCSTSRSFQPAARHTPGRDIVAGKRSSRNLGPDLGLRRARIPAW